LSAFGRPVGSLRYSLPATPLRARDHRLLDDLAVHLAGLLHAHRLTVELQAARERLVLGREEERRRLRRDLHDGLGPALAGHLLRLDLVASEVRPHSATLPHLADDVAALRADLQATVLDVRRVVEGLRPPALDELGLPGALVQATRRLTAGSPTTVRLEVADLPPLPAAMEVAVFRIVSEAVANVVRHAKACECSVHASIASGVLRVVVEDDGVGCSPRSSGDAAGHGLDTMRERAEELRGRLRIGGRADGRTGTAVLAELPIPPEARTATVRPHLSGRP
jgi:signal transduction histidine kinase